MPCNTTLELESYSHGQITFKTLPSQKLYCVLKIHVKDSMFLVRLTFNNTLTNNSKSNNQCTDYIHIGNNMNAVDMDSLTSFKLCGKPQELTAKTPEMEVVSRGSSLWLVLWLNKWNSKKPFHFNYEVLPQGTL